MRFRLDHTPPSTTDLVIVATARQCLAYLILLAVAWEVEAAPLPVEKLAHWGTPNVAEGEGGGAER